MTSIEEYKLPVCDTQSERRNFAGYEKGTWYTLAELQSGDIGNTTDTDSQTDDASKEADYSSIYKKHGGPGRSWKSSSKRTKEN